MKIASACREAKSRPSSEEPACTCTGRPWGERFATSYEAPFGLCILPPPVELPNIEINLFWHARLNKDPANRWLRQLMFDLFSDQ